MEEAVFNMLIALSLGTLISLAFLSVIFGSSWSNADMYIAGEQMSFGIDPLEGALQIIIVIILIGALVGINLMGSGLNSESVKLIIIGISYLGVWAIFTVLAYPMIFDFPLFGTIIYIGLTLMFILGIIDKYTGGNGGGN